MQCSRRGWHEQASTQSIMDGKAMRIGLGAGVPTPKKVDGGKDLTGVGPVERIRSPAQLTIHVHSGRRTRIEAIAATSGIPQLATSSEFDMVLLQNAPD